MSGLLLPLFDQYVALVGCEADLEFHVRVQTGVSRHACAALWVTIASTDRHWCESCQAGDMAGPTVPELRDAIVEALYPQSAYDLAGICVSLGLDPPNGDDPMASKRRYVRTRLFGKSREELLDLAQRIVTDYGGDELKNLIASGSGLRGVDGELKNLIFAANGPKPRIVLRDAINNVIEIVEHAEHCLVYDRPLDDDGLHWRELTSWWAEQTAAGPDDDATARALYKRLRKSLSDDSPAEHVLFEAYASRYNAKFEGRMPALLPQVYLHYDPYTLRELAAGPGQTLVRQRMDFLLLLPERARVVIEVDGRQHYADDDIAKPDKYAEMAAEDRKLRLAGYEVYRFGAHELLQADGRAVANKFFDRLLERHVGSAPPANP